MKKVFAPLLFFVFLLSFVASAQILTPVKWVWKAEQVGKGEYKLIFTAKIDAKWHTYSQYIGEGGPVKTSFTFEKNSAVELIGKTTERGGKVHDEHDLVFDMQLKYFEEALICEQKVKVKGDTKLKGVLEFMACDDHQCLPPDALDFEFDLKQAGKGIKIEWDSSRSQINSTPEKLKFDSAVQAVIQQEIKNDSLQTAAVSAGNKYGEPQSNCGTSGKTEDKSLFAIIVLGFWED